MVKTEPDASVKNLCEDMIFAYLSPAYEEESENVDTELLIYYDINPSGIKSVDSRTNDLANLIIREIPDNKLIDIFTSNRTAFNVLEKTNPYIFLCRSFSTPIEYIKALVRYALWDYMEYLNEKYGK